MKKPAAKKKQAAQKKQRRARKAALETVLILRTTDKDGRSRHGFQWPETGPVECTDWDKVPRCGNGLHGWLWGAGDWSLKSQGEGIKWKVVEVLASEVVDIDGAKVKYPRGTVLSTHTNWADAMAVIRARALKAVEHKSVATEDREIASATGDYGHASATGDYGHASATGDSGHASATGHSGHASATGHSGHASATGHSGHASATGDYGHASATGHSGHASATGHSGHASATGHYGWAIAGYNGSAKADQNGVVTILWWDQKAKRPRVAVGYVGEDGIEAGVLYAVSGGKLVTR